MSRFRLPWSARLAVTGMLAVIVLGLVAPTGVAGVTPDQDSRNRNLLGAPVGLEDVDARTGLVTPSSTQRSIVRSLGATARWNRFGTPQSLIRYGGYLATGLSDDAPTAARAFLSNNAALFRLSIAQVSALRLVNDQRMAGSAGHAVLFRQRFGGLTSPIDGMVTIGVVNGRIAYVSSSIASTTATPGAANISPTDAWLAAATNVGRVGGAISGTRTDANGFTVFNVAGFSYSQQARPRALPLYTGGVRPVYEVNVVDVKGGAALAYTSLVDAQNGAVLVRHNQVDQSMFNEIFQGSITATACGPLHPFTVDAATMTIAVTASAAIVTNDIVLKLFFNGNLVASSDTATSPEAITYSPPGGVPAGVYNVQVCPFADPTVPFTEPGNYAGTFSASEQAPPSGGVPYPPAWKYFLSNPALNFSPTNTTDNRKVGCWVKVSGVPCDDPPSPLNNLAARGPWDFNFRTNTPTFTTEGNAATTAEAWVSPLTPGGANQRPVSNNRHYGFDNPAQGFTDAWNNTRCSPTAFTPANNNNDILASVTSLFSSHNRLHDWSYFLGFTELNYNLQDNNFGNQANGTVPGGGERDPEIGNVQAGALTGGQPSFLGRDNANQITLQDGIPGITNQYLFQPIAGAFYAPCTDGDYDMTVVGHEYNHAISNRMVGGPDAGLTSFQGGSMGESWGDQVALEFLFEHNYRTGVANRADGTPALVEGPYVTGNLTKGIRNYALDANPLQYGDIGYDVTGPEVHADGEPWSAVMIDVRQALINKYNSAFPVKDWALQRRCAQGDGSNTAPQAPLDARFCPGNRRWIQLLFDAYLLQQPGTSMLDARDAMLAADQMRFGGANQAVMFNAFAKRGYGQFAQAGPNGMATGESDEPQPDYTSPHANEGRLQFTATDMTQAGQPNKPGRLYVGRYEARTTPILDTDPSTPLGSSAFFVPGTYEFVFQADGYGMRRFTLNIPAGQTVRRELHLSPNIASRFKGATITGASVGSINTNSLIDDTEATNYAARNQGVQGNGTGVSAVKPFVTVRLAGTGPQAVRSINVSALLRPANPDQDEDPNMPDDESGSRFTALRQFRFDVCRQTLPTDCVAGAPVGTAGWTTNYTSAADAFPGVLARPLAPDLLLRTFDVPDTTATHVRLVALQNQCTGAPAYQGEQDNDPTNDTDCDAASDRGTQLRASELQVYSFDSVTRPPGDPVVLTTMGAPATASAGTRITYDIGYTNLGPKASALAKITDALPVGLAFVSATNGGTYDPATRTIRWNLGTVSVNATGTVHLTVRIIAAVGTTVLNQARFTGVDTIGLPSAAATLVLP